MSLCERLLDKAVRDPARGCWLFMASLGGTGYGQIRMGNKILPAHRASYELFNGPIPYGLLVRHTCDVRRCINPTHLVLGTHLDNKHDSIGRDRHAYGEKNGAAKLSNQSVIEIRLRLANGHSIDEVAEHFKVSSHTVQDIKNGKSWKHISVP